MKSHQTTIIDIARELKLSKSTVSRALTGHPNVKQQTRVAILELAEKMEYQRNLMSVSLITNKTKTIGIIVPEFVTSFFSQVVIGAQEEARKSDYNVLISQCDEDYNIEVGNAQLMMRNRVDGIIISLTKETKNFDHIKAFQRRGIPVVFFNRVCDEIMAPKVMVNDYDAAFTAVEHLIKTGKRRIAHLAGPPSLAISRKRQNGYIDALNKHHLPVDEDLIISYDLNLSKVKIYIKHFMDMDNPPDGLFAINDPTAMEALQVIKQLGKRIPEDIGVVGFSNDYASRFVEPSLTTVAVPLAEMGRTAVKLLMDMIDTDPADWKLLIKVLDTELIIRNSTVRDA